MTGPASEIRHLDVKNEACYCLGSLGVASHDAFLLQIVVFSKIVPNGLRHAQIDRSSSETTSLDFPLAFTMRIAIESTLLSMIVSPQGKEAKTEGLRRYCESPIASPFD